MLRALALLERGVGLVLLAGIVLLIVGQVVLRSFFRLPLPWVEELGTYAFVWFTFIGASLSYKCLGHVAIRALLKHLPAWAAWLVGLCSQLFILAVLAVLAAKLPQAISWEARLSSVALPIKLPRSLFFTIPFTYTVISLMVSCCYYTLWLLVHPGARVLEAAVPAGVREESA